MKRIFYLSLAFFLTVFPGCKKVFFEPEPENKPVAVFDRLWNDFKEKYGPFQERHINWDSVYSIYRPAVNDHMQQQSLFQVCSEMLSVLNDGHVNLTAPGFEMFSSNIYYREKIKDSLFNADVIRNNYLKGNFKDLHDNGFIYGTLTNDILYVYLGYISDNNTPIISKAIDDYPNSKGLILDLRHNGGGDFTWAFSSFSRLTDKPVLVFSSATKNGPEKDQFDGWHDWYLEPDGAYFGKKIVVLTDRYTISAGERAVMALKALPEVVQIGDTTNGAHSTLIGGELQNGWYYSIATQKTKYKDGLSYEGVGMIPDITVINNLQTLRAGTDQVLDKAISQF